MKRQQLQDFRNEFETLHMKKGQLVDKYFSRTLIIVNKMRIHGDKLKDIAVVEKIIHSMTQNFAYVVCLIKGSKKFNELYINELQSLILVNEQRMKNVHTTYITCHKTQSTHSQRAPYDMWDLSNDMQH